MRLHLHFKHLKREAVTATEQLFSLKPWRIKDEPQAEEQLQALTQAWTDELCRVYDVPHVQVYVDYKHGHRYGEYEPVNLELDEEGAPNNMNEAQITLGYFSVTTLFWRFAQHLQANGKLEVSPEGDFYTVQSRLYRAPFAWATSLFYTCKPVMFRARVRENRIANMTAYDTYSRETLAQFEDAGINPADRDALDQLRGAENEAIALDEPPVSEEAYAAETETLTTGTNGGQTEADGDTPLVPAALQAMNTRELRRYATEQGITGSWNMTKAQLLEALGVSS